MVVRVVVAIGNVVVIVDIGTFLVIVFCSNGLYVLFVIAPLIAFGGYWWLVAIDVLSVCILWRFL